MGQSERFRLTGDRRVAARFGAATHVMQRTPSWALRSDTTMYAGGPNRVRSSFERPNRRESRTVGLPEPSTLGRQDDRNFKPVSLAKHRDEHGIPGIS